MRWQWDGDGVLYWYWVCRNVIEFSCIVNVHIWQWDGHFNLYRLDSFEWKTVPLLCPWRVFVHSATPQFRQSTKMEQSKFPIRLLQTTVTLTCWNISIAAWIQVEWKPRDPMLNKRTFLPLNAGVCVSVGSMLVYSVLGIKSFIKCLLGIHYYPLLKVRIVVGKCLSKRSPPVMIPGTWSANECLSTLLIYSFRITVPLLGLIAVGRALSRTCRTCSMI